jgi:hypothetical protein
MTKIVKRVRGDAATEDKDYGPTRTLFAIQRLADGAWVTEKLFGLRDFAEAYVARLGAGWRVEAVQREIFD